MKLSLVTDTVTEPVTLTEMKLFLKEDLSNEDDLISSLITSARKVIEDYCNITMCTKVYDYYLDEFKDVIKLPLAPCQSVDNFVYNNLDYTETEVSSSRYKVFTYNGVRRAEIVLRPSQTYDDLSIADYNAIRVRFTAGYGDNASDIPEALKTAIKLTVGHWHENRESQGIPAEAKRIAHQFKLIRV